MNSNKPYDDFLKCFNCAKEIVVSDEELQKRMESFNNWFVTLKAAERNEIAAKVVAIISEAQEVIRNKQTALEQMILANHTQSKANARYGKYE
ncbi:MAG: flagellar biosynthesis protein FlgG [Ectobacillus sp.]